MPHASEAMQDAVQYFRSFSPEVKQKIGRLTSRALGAKKEPIVEAGTYLNSRMLTFFENASKGAFFGGEGMERITTNQQEAVKKATQAVMRQVGPDLSPAELGTIVNATIQGNFDVARTMTKPLYNKIEFDPRVRVVFEDVENVVKPERSHQVVDGPQHAGFTTVTSTAV